MPTQAEAAENRKRKAERLADHPRLQKIQKQFHIKTETSDTREVPESVTEEAVQEDAQQTASESDDDESDESGSDSDSDEDGPDGGDQDGSESPSSSDTDAESSSDSEDEQDEEHDARARPETFMEQAEPSETPTAEKLMSASNAPSDPSTRRMNTYYDILANLEPTDAVVSAAINSIASEYFEQIFPGAARELTAQRRNFAERLREKQVSEDRVAEYSRSILKAQSKRISKWLDKVRKDIDALNHDAPAGMRHINGNARRREERRQQNPRSKPLVEPTGSNNAALSAPNHASGQSHHRQIASSPAMITPSRPVAMANAHSMATNPSVQESQPRTIWFSTAYDFFLHHVERIAKKSSLVNANIQVRSRAGEVWRRHLNVDSREQWETLRARLSQDDGLASNTDLVDDLCNKQDIIAKLTQLNDSNVNTPGHGASTQKSSFGSSGRRPADCYRPER